jgi:hypothetical protein
MYHASRQPRFKQMVSVHITSDCELFCDIEAMQMGLWFGWLQSIDGDIYIPFGYLT